MSAAFSFSTTVFLAAFRCAFAIPWGDPSISIGCFLWGWSDQDARIVTSLQEPSVPNCQKACADDPNCGVFNYKEDNTCELGSGSFGGNLQQSNVGDLTGPKHCELPVAPACKALPNEGWPAPTLTESFSLWSIGFQPQPEQCWEKTSAAELVQCADVHVLEILEGVQGCSGMTVKDTGSKTCQQVCEENMHCATWIVRSDGLCYTGLGTGCFSGDAATANAATAGARLLHGNYRVLAPMNVREVAGLTKIMTKTETEGLGPRAAAACKNICLSSIECQYWQLRKEGCWIENEVGSTNVATYPLLSSMLSDTAVNIEVIDGEYLQRFCPSAIPSLVGAYQPTTTSTTTTTTTTKTTTTTTTSGVLVVGAEKSHGASSWGDSSSDPASSGSDSSDSSDSSASWPWWGWLLMLLLCLCCLAACIASIMFAMGLCGKKGAKKKRAVSRPVYREVAEPSVTVERPVPVRQVVPVQTMSTSVPSYQPVVTREVVSAPQAQYQFYPVSQPTFESAQPAYQAAQQSYQVPTYQAVPSTYQTGQPTYAASQPTYAASQPMLQNPQTSPLRVATPWTS